MGSGPNHVSMHSSQFIKVQQYFAVAYLLVVAQCLGHSERDALFHVHLAKLQLSIFSSAIAFTASNRNYIEGFREINRN